MALSALLMLLAMCLSASSARQHSPVAFRTLPGNKEIRSVDEAFEMSDLKRMFLEVKNTLDCRVRLLAYQQGLKLQPWHAPQREVFDALELQTHCNVTPPGLRPRPPQHGHVGEVEAASAFYVDYVHGSDTNSGTMQSPFKTVKRALAASRAAGGGGSIILRAGVHYLEESIDLGEKDSGLTITNAPHEEVWISGGVPLTTNWQAYNVTKNVSNVWVTEVASGVIDDITGLVTLEPHTRLTRARTPDANPEIDRRGWMDRKTVSTWHKPPPPEKPAEQFFINLTTSHPSKNDSTMPTYNYYGTGKGGYCNRWTPPESYWCSNISAGGWAFMDHKGPLLPIGMTYNTTLLPQASGWKNAKGGFVHVWRWFGWFVNMYEIDEHDPEKATMSFSKGGDQGGRGWQVNDTTGELLSGGMYFENVFEALDAPNEWFFSKSDRHLYVYYNGTGAPPKDLQFIGLSQQSLISMQGTQEKPVRNITVSGINFRDAAYTYMTPHGVPSGGDWSLQRNAAVFLEGTEHVHINNCSFVRLDGNAFMLSGYNRYAVVAENVFAWTGDSAMAAWGYTEENDGTNGEQPRNNSILFNYAYELGIYQKQSSMWFQAKSCLNLLQGNIFFNGPRAGINMNDGFGGGTRIIDNLLFNQCRETGDHGDINTWDRQPFMTKVRDGVTRSYSPADNEVATNFIIANYGASQGIDNDDGSSWYNIHDNFFYQADGFKMDYGGHDSKFWKNLIVVMPYDGQNCFNMASFFPGHGDGWYENRCIVTYVDVVGTILQCNSNNLQESVQVDLHGNQYYTPHGNASVNCGRKSIPLAVLQAGGIEKGSVGQKLPTDDQILQWATEILKM